MRIPLTSFGWPQVVVLPMVLLAIMVIYLLIGIIFLPAWAVILGELVPAALLIWVLSFFRDPHRLCPSDVNILLAPADGQVMDVETVNEDNFIGGEALRVGIFLSIFSAHINRSPCNVKVEKISYKPGSHKVASNPEAGRVNESNELHLIRTDNPKDKLIVRQISGSIARRIVCRIKAGQQLSSGEKFGMIKFGSRTELYVPLSPNSREYPWGPKCLIRVGDKVKAGLTPIVKYEVRKTNNEKIKNEGC